MLPNTQSDSEDIRRSPGVQAPRKRGRRKQAMNGRFAERIGRSDEKRLDLREFLQGWPYDPGDNVRLARGDDGREIILVRQPMGLEEYEAAGRPDGHAPFGMESMLEVHRARLEEARKGGTDRTFHLTAADCAELFDEGVLYYHRCVHYFQLRQWERADRDAARSLRWLDFVSQHAERDEDRREPAAWRPCMMRLSAVARAMIQLDARHCSEAPEIAQAGLPDFTSRGNSRKNPEELAVALAGQVNEADALRGAARPAKEFIFRNEGDYWTVIYAGQTARFKDTRGINCLARLLRHPNHEFHAVEIMTEPVECLMLDRIGSAGRETEISALTVRGRRGDPILDPQAKAAYKLRIQELREDVEEAERCNDWARAAIAREEWTSIAGKFAASVGLGGRDRASGAEAERARSAVTKRIKETIRKIAGAIPPLGRHLATGVKTGYYCSYHPDPDLRVEWKF